MMMKYKDVFARQEQNEQLLESQTPLLLLLQQQLRMVNDLVLGRNLMIILLIYI